MLVDYCSDYIMFDLETTGLSTDDNAIVEISAVKVTDGEISVVKYLVFRWCTIARSGNH